MDQLLNIKKPTLQQQIDFVRQARTETVRVIKTSEMMDMMMAIEENLIAVKMWNQANAKTPSELVSGVGKAFEELLNGLIAAKESIKTWHNMGASDEQASTMWSIYENNSPEMKKLNSLIAKYKLKEVSNG
jgi:hypothetical protein